MRLGSILVLASALFLLPTGCDEVGNTVETYTDPAEALAKRKLERHAKVSELFAEYGGGVAANIGANTVDEMKVAVEDAATPDPASAAPAGGPSVMADGGSNPLEALMKDALNSAKTAVVESDRAQFEAYCIQLGNGDRVVPLTEKAQAFFAKPETAEACRAVNAMDRDIKELEAKVKAAGIH
jgi:hypothetical protein